ncbi:MAG: CpXC domain-containing protein [Chloroflexota bacterium]|nr:CpXC domain-containing protein [Chloroflexota bacterium]
MPKIQTACPNCGQPVLSDSIQVFDVGVDPRLKDILLSGRVNITQCQNCGYQGALPLPIVYHDPEKELLLTFSPPDAQSTMQQRESALAPLLRQVTENLAPEQRKGYLFQPQTMLTMKALVEKVLEADGITKEMLDAQEKKMHLFQRLMGVAADAQREIVKQEEALIDEEFFVLFSRLAEMLPPDADPGDIEKLQSLQEILLTETEYGREIKRKTEELEAAQASLEQLGKNLTREKLLSLVINAPNVERVEALTRLARPGMDYAFVQMFTDAIEQTKSPEREQLVERRNLILRLTNEIDEQINARGEAARKNVEAFLEADDIPQAVAANIGAIDDFFVHALKEALDFAHKEGNLERSAKLQQIFDAINEMASPPEMKLIEELLSHAGDEDELKKAIAARGDEITPRLFEYFAGLLGQVEESFKQLQGANKEQQQAALEGLNVVYQAVLRFSMEKKMREG